MAAQRETDHEFPAEFYRAIVDSMFGDARSFTVGGLAFTAVALAVAAYYESVAFLAMAFVLVAFTGARLALVNRYNQIPHDCLDTARLKRWELYYTLAAGAHVLVLGVFFLITVIETPEGFGRMAGLTAVMGYLVGIPGRNFANGYLVNVLVACAAAPVLLALTIAGGHNWLLALLIVAPFFWSLRHFSLRLRGIFLSAVSRARDVSRLASELDSALNNMPCGLAMLDARGQVVVVNRRLEELFDIQHASIPAYGTFSALLADASMHGVIGQDQARQIVEGLKLRVAAGGGEEDWQAALLNGRVLKLTMQPRGDGGVVVLFEDVTEHNQAQARINELARFNSLTGLPNRVEFGERGAAVLAAKPDDVDAALLFIDLDQFKQVNDTLGHAVGDHLLRAAAERLRRAVGPDDLVARLGGDEFVVLIGAAQSLAPIEGVARAIIGVLAEPFEISGHELRLGASIGVARSVDVGPELGALLRCADLALYEAKAEGRGVWRLFESGMEARARERRELEFDLRRALEFDLLELHFQPIYNIAEKKFLGCEALLRWRHPTRGAVSPAVFVPMAEEMGLVNRLDEWVVKRACLAAATWPKTVSVAVNLSAVHFRDFAVIDLIKDALCAAALSPHRLEIEITETAALQNLELTRSILCELRKIGVRVSLDDFGTGYSSLSYLHTLPLNKIKINRSFLEGVHSNLQAMKLLTGVARLSKDLGLLIVMEGVETEEQLAMITSSTPVDEIQGFLFSPALPLQEITRVLEEEQRAAA